MEVAKFSIMTTVYKAVSNFENLFGSVGLNRVTK